MDKLTTLRKYAEKLRKASTWHSSKEAIAHISKTHNNARKKDYIYEFYCSLRILLDLKINYKIVIKNRHTNKNVFPKSPGSKSNYPYFMLTNHVNSKQKFQICLGVDIKGMAGETSAPDISFQTESARLKPTFKNIIMIMDAKFKHKLNRRIAEVDFNKVSMMVINLNCGDADLKSKVIQFDKLKQLRGNCIISNGLAYKTNSKHHKQHKIKEIVKFDEGHKFKVIG